MNWKEHFYYHDGKLFWTRTDVVAGYMHGSGYVRVGLQGKSYAAIELFTSCITDILNVVMR